MSWIHADGIRVYVVRYKREYSEKYISHTNL